MNEKQENNLASLYNADLDDLLEEKENEQFFYSSLQNVEDRYQNIRFLASGGEKSVSKAFDTQTGRDVAMAKLNNEASHEQYESFLREARLTALLDHPNIISIFDIALDEHLNPYFTMELKVGKSLSELILEYSSLVEGADADNPKIKKNISGKSPKKHLLEIFLKVCDAVSYAHSINVIHLDLKPDNIQVGQYGEVVVCDWGLGKVLGNSLYENESQAHLINPDYLNNQTLVGVIKGTPGYMAPEQIVDGGKKDTSTDIYTWSPLIHAYHLQKPCGGK